MYFFPVAFSLPVQRVVFTHRSSPPRQLVRSRIRSSKTSSDQSRTIEPPLPLEIVSISDRNISSLLNQSTINIQGLYLKMFIYLPAEALKNDNALQLKMPTPLSTDELIEHFASMSVSTLDLPPVSPVVQYLNGGNLPITSFPREVVNHLMYQDFVAYAISQVYVHLRSTNMAALDLAGLDKYKFHPYSLEKGFVHPKTDRSENVKIMDFYGKVLFEVHSGVFSHTGLPRPRFLPVIIADSEPPTELQRFKDFPAELRVIVYENAFELLLGHPRIITLNEVTQGAWRLTGGPRPQIANAFREIGPEFELRGKYKRMFNIVSTRKAAVFSPKFDYLLIDSDFRFALAAQQAGPVQQVGITTNAQAVGFATQLNVAPASSVYNSLAVPADLSEVRNLFIALTSLEHNFGGVTEDIKHMTSLDTIEILGVGDNNQGGFYLEMEFRDIFEDGQHIEPMYTDPYGDTYMGLGAMFEMCKYVLRPEERDRLFDLWDLIEAAYKVPGLVQVLPNVIFVRIRYT